ncbi:sulfotransferase 1B1-like [Mya arenaria]|uniref:sulfotransferase 1B1-like n=1 Tax=Mya arenaria TaxID=6604 RepID=UPI0022DEB56D|nr:sulfotransferase 1B1-like [Mya arenaria]XP_052819660.1 sulfotransferase 1B1-like [Mya arenaria]XP_052819661.1 sulfotransferase 1B1-like [Mya arenaria]XP_052819662.1 sulfotransferase 1B1-like [Mya arenaria]
MTSFVLTDEGGATMQLVDIDGYKICNFYNSAEEEGELVRALKTFECRDDDVFILAPMKSGTHWVWEIASMLLQGKAETIPKRKSKNMLENVPQNELNDIPSPRILNSHLDFKFLPEQLFEKKCKIIHILRNPKDMAVSFYNHVKGITCYAYDGEWQHYLKLFLEEKLEYGSWFGNVLSWETFVKANPSYPVHVIYYEELQKNNVSEIERLAKFLGVDFNDQLVNMVSEKCQFSNMSKDKLVSDDLRKLLYKGNFTMYRKGAVGDWKNWFTVAQNEEFDRVYNQKMKHSALSFQYTI